MARHISKELYTFNIGTIGHIDHGKTTLTAAITKGTALQGLAEKKDTTQTSTLLQKKEKELLQSNSLR